MENYERKFNQLLGVVREFYPSMSDYQKEKFEGICPELAESEDEKMLDSIIEDCKKYLALLPKQIAWLEKQKEKSIPWYDYLKSKEAGYTIVPNEEYDQLKNKMHAEWSEEDCDIIYAIESALEMLIIPEAGIGLGEVKGVKTEKMISWFKSIKHQQHWKPTEEQMKAFEGVLDYLWETKNPDVKNYGFLLELHKALSKL